MCRLLTKERINVGAKPASPAAASTGHCPAWAQQCCSLSSPPSTSGAQNQTQSPAWHSGLHRGHSKKHRQRMPWGIPARAAGAPQTGLVLKELWVCLALLWRCRSPSEARGQSYPQTPSAAGAACINKGLTWVLDLQSHFSHEKTVLVTHIQRFHCVFANSIRMCMLKLHNLLSVHPLAVWASFTKSNFSK